MSITEKSPIRELQNRREAVLRDPVFIAEEEFLQQTLEIYADSGSYERYLECDPAERERELQELRDSGRIKDRKDAVSERPDYIAEQEFKQCHREMFLKSDRFKKSDRYQEYLKRQQAENSSEVTQDETE